MPRPSKKSLLLERTEEYLALHQQDPERYPATIDAAAEFVPCSRTLFYKSDPEIQEIADRLREAGEPVTEDLVLTREDDTLEVLTDGDLEKETEQTIRRAVLAMQKFLGQHGRPGRPVEGVLAAYDLAVVLGTLQRVQADLKPLVAEQQRRERDRTRMPEEPPADRDPSLFDAAGGGG